MHPIPKRTKTKKRNDERKQKKKMSYGNNEPANLHKIKIQCRFDDSGNSSDNNTTMVMTTTRSSSLPRSIFLFCISVNVFPHCFQTIKFEFIAPHQPIGKYWPRHPVDPATADVIESLDFDCHSNDNGKDNVRQPPPRVNGRQFCLEHCRRQRAHANKYNLFIVIRSETILHKWIRSDLEQNGNSVRAYRIRF